MRDLPPRTTLSPRQAREQEQHKEAVKAACALWSVGQTDLPDEHAQLCVDAGWDR